MSEENKKLVAKATGWVVLGFGLLSLPGILRSLGISKSLAPFWHVSTQLYARWIINYIFSIVQVILMLVAVPDLLKLKNRGWQFLYWAILLGLLSSIITFSGFGLVISIVFLYLLYQTKKVYK